MNDYIVRATAGNAQIRAFAAVTTNLVEEARASRNKSGCASSAGKTPYRRSDDGKHDEE